MMGLEFVKIEKAPEEVRRRKAQSALKMGGKTTYSPGVASYITGLIYHTPSNPI
jgi:hypothetical protein